MAHLGEAQRLGFPRERLLPWLAEAAFLKGDYARTRELLASLGTVAALPDSAAIISPVAPLLSVTAVSHPASTSAAASCCSRSISASMAACSDALLFASACAASSRARSSSTSA